MTKSYRFKKNLIGFISLLCKFGPLIFFLVSGFIQAEGKEKLCLSITAIASIIIALIAAMREVHLKSTGYILLIGLWVALDRLLPCIITIAICTILDELIFSPVYKRLNEDYHTNIQLDKRLKS